tara:strand:+ start:823 stop:1464 length:642 start_codon:yes stop_codon:yes gene_type:complete
MSKEYGYIGKEVEQAFRDNKGIFTPQDIIELDQENKWTNFGQLELIETANVSSSTSTVEFTDLKDFDVHLLTVNDGTVSQDNGGIAFRLYESGTLESGSVYHTARQICGADGSFSENKSTSNSAFRFADNILLSSVPRGNINGYLYFYNLLDSTKYSFTTQHSTTWSNSDIYRSFFGSNVLPQASAVNIIQVMAFNTGTIESGNFSLYGIRSF